MEKRRTALGDGHHVHPTSSGVGHDLVRVIIEQGG
jgi:hypothetical protein